LHQQQIGKYRILGKIGQGAMGEVFRAHDPVIGRDVAIKVMSASVGDDEELRRRFQREARSAGRLNHPNIVTIYDYGEDRGRIYIAMELLEGRDLKDLIGTRAPLSLDQKLDLMHQVCDGLTYAHAKEVVHRDLKPANVQLLPSGLVKIMDFGLARDAASDITGAGMILGTPNYMSPEQMQGQKATAQSDVFSLGVLFYELLSYRKPFTGESLHAILLQVLQGEPEPLARAAPDVPPAIGAVVERALERDLDRRYPSADAMRQALRGALAEAPAASAAPAATLESTVIVPRLLPARTWMLRRGRILALAAMAGVAIVMLLSAAGITAYRLSRSEPAAEPASPPGRPALRPTPTPTPITSAAAASPRPPSPTSPARSVRPSEPRPRVEASRSTPRPQPAPASAAPPAPRPSAASAIPSVPMLPPPTHVLSPSPPGAPDEAAAVRDIQQVLSRYRSAFQALDVEALKAVYPGVDEPSARKLFASIRAYEVSLKVERIEVAGLVATAQCLGTYKAVPKPPGDRGRPLRQTFELRWNGQGWTILRVHTRS
jgi:eukaryotic-like serine/threonine-protein kinase